MHKKNARSRVITFAIVFVVGLAGPSMVYSATTPSLGAAASYGVLAGTYVNTSAATTVNGDIGFSTGPAITPLGVHPNFGSGAPVPAARIDAASALSSGLASQPCTFNFAAGAVDLATDGPNGATGIYPPGVYCSTGAMNIGAAGITLSGAGTFIFRAVGALTTTDNSNVTMLGSSACDVFWTPTAATTLGADTTFVGTIIDNANAITVGANTTWIGRALSLGAGSVTTGASSTLSVPVCGATFHVIKTVTNDSGGVSVASDFNIHVTNLGIDVAGSPAVAAGLPGTTFSLAAGTYVVSEDINLAYAQSFSGDCDATGNITLALGDDKTCTITNNDIAAVLPATLNVTKIVINDNGRTKVVADFPLFVNGGAVVSGITNVFAAPAAYTVTETSNISQYKRTFSGDCDASGQVNLVPGDIKFCIITNNDIAAAGGSGGGGLPPVPPLIDVVKVPNPLALPGGPGPVLYTYTLKNVGTVPVTDITLVGDTCSPIVLISGDVNGDSKLDVTETWVYTCTTTLTATHTNTVVATGFANGLSVSDIASATVIVGLPVVPPLIHVTKIPSPLTLPLGGGFVTYTERITNPGTVPLSNVTLSDDKCTPMKFISGDVNNDSKLDATETWTYTCISNLTATTTNTAVASGEANGLKVRDFAIATVVVPVAGPTPTPTPVVPGLPLTGFAPVENNSAWFFVATGISAFSILLFVIRKRRNS